MTKIVVISDTHGQHLGMQIPDGDILIHCGDFCSHGRYIDALRFVNWFGTHPHKHKIFIAGNHDFGFQHLNTIAPEYIEKGVNYLFDSSVEIDEIKFYGSPWQPEFYNWAFNLPRNGKELEEKWNNIPDDTDILITHGPAWGTLDTVVNRRDMNLGCEMLAKRLEVVKPLIHSCGHIHTGYGYVEKNGTHFFNASILDERYRHNQKPFDITINLENKQIDII
jgi:Icc-related predicted phosphoesterase